MTCHACEWDPHEHHAADHVNEPARHAQRLRDGEVCRVGSGARVFVAESVPFCALQACMEGIPAEVVDAKTIGEKSPVQRTAPPAQCKSGSCMFYCVFGVPGHFTPESIASDQCEEAPYASVLGCRHDLCLQCAVTERDGVKCQSPTSLPRNKLFLSVSRRSSVESVLHTLSAVVWARCTFRHRQVESEL